MTVKANAERVIGPAFSDGHAQFSEVREEFGQKVSANGGNSFPTDTELTAIKIPFGPEEEGQSHREGLPTAHGAVADNGVKLAGVPPCKNLFLFRGEGHISPPNQGFGQRNQGPDKAAEPPDRRRLPGVRKGFRGRGRGQRV